MKYRILIVEDNIMLAGQQKKRLEKSGYEAEITIDEPGARKLLKKESFDLVLSDVRLPEGDGISLLEWMRKERMDIPFIIMTGYASVPDAVQAIKLGAKDYLAKPVQMDELQRQLKDIFRPKSVICDKNKDLLPRNSLQMQEVEHLVRGFTSLSSLSASSGISPSRPYRTGLCRPEAVRAIMERT